MCGLHIQREGGNMVGNLMIFIFCFGIFAATALFVCVRRKYLSIFLAGIGAFMISQLMLRIPALKYLNGLPAYFQWSLANPIAAGLFAAVTAGIFEEIFRYIGFCLLKKRKELSWKEGLVFGLGHGGIEAVWLGIQVLPYLSSGTMTELNKFLCGFERMCTLSVHTALTMVVLEAVRTGKRKYLLLAVILHTAVDFPIVLLSSPYLLEGYVFLCALAGAVYIWKKRKFSGREASSDECSTAEQRFAEPRERKNQK